MNRRIIAILLTLCLAAAGCAATEPTEQLTQTAGSTSGEQTAEGDSQQEEAVDVTSKAYSAVIDIADYGKIAVELDGEAAPATVENFVKLAESGFYDGLTFHRIMAGFMMQGGDPEGNGTGGAEQDIVGEFSANGFDNPLSHTRGAISMARSMDFDSASSQFFIVHQDSAFLDGQYAAFGYVSEGMDVVDAVCAAAKPLDNNGTIAPADQPVITSITISAE